MFVRRWLERAGTAVRSRIAAARGKAGPDHGMTTAEYALGTLAACAAAALLYKVLTSGAMESALRSVIAKALGVHV